jgi:diguanylate cyclase (GGDEF)-like protein/PAS domain S-box-containing protein
MVEPPLSSRAARALRWAALPFAIVLLIAVAAVSYGQVRQFREDLSWRVHTYEVLQHIERTQTALLGADSMRRSYRLSRDRRDLEQMERRVASASNELDAVVALTRDNASQQERVRALRPAIAERLTVLHDGLELPEWDQLDAATRDEQRARQLHGSDLAKRVGAAIDAMRDEELRLLAEREQRMLRSAEATQTTLLYGSALGIALVSLVAGSLLLENRRRLRAQGELASANNLFNAVLEGTTDVIAVKDTAGRYLLINPAGCRNLGRAPGDVIGRTDRELLTGGTGESVMAADADVLRRGETVTFEQVASVGDRTWTFSSTKGPFRGAAREILGVIAVSRDISDRKRMEEKLAEQNLERGQIIARLERQSNELAILGEMATLLQSAQVPGELHALVGYFTTRLFDAAGSLAVFAPSCAYADDVARWGGESPGPPFSASDCWGLRSGRPHTSRSGGVVCAHVRPESLPRLCVPLVAQGEMLGVLQLQGEALAGADPQLLGAFSEPIALALANLQLREALRAQAIRDPLTNLYNRRYMDETFARELARVGRKGAPLSLVMIDVDHFKRLNDTAGHSAGDAVLKRVALRLMSGVRREDVPCRFGGEEFALVLPELPIERAAERAERLRGEIEGMFPDPDVPGVGPVTASFGVSCFPAHGTTEEGLLRAADAALYQAKRGGRNRVVLAEVGEEGK